MLIISRLSGAWWIGRCVWCAERSSDLQLYFYKVMLVEKIQPKAFQLVNQVGFNGNTRCLGCPVLVGKAAGSQNIQCEDRLFIRVEHYIKLNINTIPLAAVTKSKIRRR